MINFVPFAKGILNNNLETKAAQLGLILGTAGAVSKSNWNSPPSRCRQNIPHQRRIESEWSTLGWVGKSLDFSE